MGASTHRGDRMALRKKAYFFSITVLLIIGVATLIMSGLRDPGHQRTASLANQRLVELQTFINGVEKDAITATNVATNRALLTVQEIIQTEGALANPKRTIAELIINGSYQGNEQPLLENESLEEWEEHIQPLAHYLRIIIDVTINEIVITQQDPWHIITIANMTLYAHDNYTESTWNQTFITTTSVPIIGLADPLYTIGTDGRYTQLITRTTLPINDFQDHINNHKYIASTNAPSYLYRLAGNMNINEQGIESLVDVNAVAAVNVNNQGSIIDWQYFGTPVITTCPISGLLSWAVIDQAQIARYGLSC